MYQELFFVCFFLEFFYQETFGFIILKKKYYSEQTDKTTQLTKTL